MSTLLFIGTIKKQANCGESMKNHLFIDRFRELFDKVITIDIFQPRKHPLCIAKVFITAFLYRNSKIILSVSPATGDKFIRLLLILGCKNVYYWAVGILLMDYFQQGRFDAKVYNQLKAIYVQNPIMVKVLKECGVNNVFYVPNSKRINYLPTFHDNKGLVTKFVFLSRIHPEKGCLEIIEVARQLNSQGLEHSFIIDFYGAIALDFERPFIDMIESCPNVNYMGFLDLYNHEGYDRLSTYDVMLFPTYYDGEAFPGVVIDAFIAGLPVIASDWHFNKEIIDEEVGILVKPKDIATLMNAMAAVINKTVDMPVMREHSQERALTYDNRRVLSKDNLIKLGLL